MSNKPLLVVLSGAGISAESGIKTFRDANGLWENHRIEDVASPHGFLNNTALVHDFYNQRRAQAMKCEPNAGHLGLVDLEKEFDVVVVTQNVDGLHEKAGSKTVIHLHGELSKASCWDEYCGYVEEIGDAPMFEDELCPHGHMKRPFIVWFGEDVPKLQEAADWVRKAEYVVIIGTSLQVYPAAGLLYEAHPDAVVYYIDPNPAPTPSHIKIIPEGAGKGVAILKEFLGVE
jgi:NAD-dependent deacetylase